MSEDAVGELGGAVGCYEGAVVVLCCYGGAVVMRMLTDEDCSQKMRVQLDGTDKQMMMAVSAELMTDDL